MDKNHEDLDENMRAMALSRRFQKAIDNFCIEETERMGVGVSAVGSLIINGTVVASTGHKAGRLDALCAACCMISASRKLTPSDLQECDDMFTGVLLSAQAYKVLGKSEEEWTDILKKFPSPMPPEIYDKLVSAIKFGDLIKSDGYQDVRSAPRED